MRRIGIIGGMSYESTLHYYERINRQVNERAGGLVSADLVLRSVNFEEYHEMMEKGDWAMIGKRLSDEATKLVIEEGCRYIAIATNTMHKVASYVSGRHGLLRQHYARPMYADVQLVHIGDCIAEKCKKEGIQRVALLGTRFTMTDGFMKKRLQDNGLEVIDTFKKSEIDEIDRIIFDELCHGVVKPKSENRLLNIAANADDRDMDNGGTGIDGFILGCTELEMLFSGEPYFFIKPRHKHHFKFINSTQAHIDKIVELCLEDTE
ncbi:MAG: amino acid racemase [Candidatus Saccharimonadaceae bacterium]|nr:amino acid racemase [Candidatus Saccharimonadaceae bacterium]